MATRTTTRSTRSTAKAQPDLAALIAASVAEAVAGLTAQPATKAQPKGNGKRTTVHDPEAPLTPKQYSVLYFEGHRIGFDRSTLGVTIGGEAVNRGAASELLGAIFAEKHNG